MAANPLLLGGHREMESISPFLESGHWDSPNYQALPPGLGFSSLYIMLGIFCFLHFGFLNFVDIAEILSYSFPISLSFGFMSVVVVSLIFQ